MAKSQKSSPPARRTLTAGPSSKVSAAAPAVISPRDIMLPYQRRWADDESRFKIGLMARQTGKDFSSGEEGVRDCYKHDLAKDKVDWLIGAAGERQALESMEKWKAWTEAYKLAIADYQEDRENSQALLKSATITFPHGSRVIAIPANPNTVRGYSANVLLTEFAFLEDPDATWRAIIPSITNPLRGGEKKIRLISTPNGIGNKFHDLWVKNYQVQGSKWSCHRVSIHDAVADGLPVNIEELRAAIDDPEGWAQEFELDFLDSAAVLLGYDLIALCENPLATVVCSPEFWLASAANAEPIDLGIDFGRKRDLTVCWSLATIGGAYKMTREVLTLSKMSTPDQIAVLRPRIQRARRVCLDYTGPGTGMGDYLVKEFGQWDPDAHQFGKIELCTFSNTLKLDIFPKLRMAFEARTIGIPSDRVIREDLHSMHRCVTSSGGISYRAPLTPDGHADRCTALALANRASSNPVAPGRIIAVTRGGSRSADRRHREVTA